MSEVVIDIKNLSKLYRLGTISSGTLSRDISSAWARFRGKEDPNSKLSVPNDIGISNGDDRVWALKDINLQVKQGEILGIIGKNGAGKSTLLKILSRVTSPTSGIVKIKGRVGSLLEVSTGFHPELTGKENIYLNGAILGMTKVEIDSKYNEIIDFSGVNKYINTPIKRYSSGMKVRLGFSVAAHLNGDILLVDEVLAVGDIEFKKKCIGELENISEAGRTIFFVSHDLMAISSLCPKSIILDCGEIIFRGKTSEAIDIYSKKFRKEKDFQSFRKIGELGNSSLNNFTVGYNQKNNFIQSDQIPLGCPIMFSIEMEDLILETRKLIVNIEIHSLDRVPITSIGNEFSNDNIYYSGEKSFHEFEIITENLLLRPGEYIINLWIRDSIYGPLCYLEDIRRIEIIETDIFNSGRLPNKRIQGYIISKSTIRNKI